MSEYPSISVFSSDLFLCFARPNLYHSGPHSPSERREFEDKRAAADAARAEAEAARAEREARLRASIQVHTAAFGARVTLCSRA